MGLFVITNFSFSHNLSSIAVSLSLKDKMCLLNGEFGGTFPAAVTFDNYQVQDNNGNITVVRPTIYQIITELLNHFGGQQLGNIIISDLDTRIKQVMQWSGSGPLYVLTTNDLGNYIVTANEEDALTKLSNGYHHVPGSPFESGSNVGFILTDFSYPGDLIGNAGESIVSILEKIKNTLGNFEFFYDIDGHFRFQQIKNYLNNTQSKYILESLKKGQFVPDYFTTNEAYVAQYVESKSVFSFKDNSNLVISYSNTPQIQNIKNDYVIWGIRKSASGQEYPIRYHLAIDKKPQLKKTTKYKVIKYVDLYDGKTQKWYKPMPYNSSAKGIPGILYADSSNRVYVWKKENGLSKYVQINATVQEITPTDWRTELYFQGVIAEPTGINSNFYYTELESEWPKIYDIEQGKFRDQVINNSASMDFYLDFINPVTEQMQKISIDRIGRRTQVINKDSDINCVFEPYIPDVILINKDYPTDDSTTLRTDMQKLRKECDEKGLFFSQVDEDVYNYLTPGRALNSCYQAIKQTLNQYIHYSENISLQTLPVYFLQPNVCIEVQDKDTQISGDYIINTLSFSPDSTSINATKVISKNM